jgi:hypothetical protein
MTDYRIVCTKQTDVSYPYTHGHIYQVGTGPTADRYTLLWTREEVVNAILKGWHTFHTIGIESGNRAEVYTVECGACGTRIIQTKPDAAKDNNLDYLPRCG